ncbi:TetR/AcrR family transcriptional regulator [Agromyces indicus]|uniref:TetR/AcrR family transcriptional regulator n=1 Tax=Agromyces indicus TaxID=758919 RepID=A0ABU1FI10_9MICO|nr:TetR/AcrR family transcriptional regulator [Agromyces indicus]MDR5691389.1 TetR/AcrR family transcriptional regulator [Agromyces indicus]
MARPKNQALRRGELVAATSRLLIERGAAGARLTDIAEAAGLTPASVSYYYPDLVELYAETHQTAAIEYITGRRARVEARTGPEQRMRECLRLGIPMEGEPSFDATVLLIELGALSTRNHGFDAAADEFERAQVELFEQLVDEGVAAGLYTPATSTAHVARTLLAIEDGLALSVIRGRLAPHDALELISDAASALLRHRIGTD